MKITKRELDLLNGMLDHWKYHAKRCDNLNNRVMAEKQKHWDMERVHLLTRIIENSEVIDEDL